MDISQKFRMWLVLAQPGEEFAYHNGLLAKDREMDGRVEQVAQDAMLATKQGLVELFQRRLPYTPLMTTQPYRSGCLYLARRTGKVVPRG